MVTSDAEASSSCSFDSNSRWQYQVFLSFRGEDTRRGFTDHLYASLQRRGITTFRDDRELGRGEVISSELLKGIEGSMFAIIVLSPNYAFSSWCLDELQKIVECREFLGQSVFPIFYGVDPSDVRHQRGLFAEAFRKHEEKFQGDREKVQRWRDVLKEVASISGWDSKDRHEVELIESIVDDIQRKLIKGNFEYLMAIFYSLNHSKLVIISLLLVILCSGYCCGLFYVHRRVKEAMKQEKIIMRGAKWTWNMLRRKQGSNTPKIGEKAAWQPPTRSGRPLGRRCREPSELARSTARPCPRIQPCFGSVLHVILGFLVAKLIHRRGKTQRRSLRLRETL